MDISIKKVTKTLTMCATTLCLGATLNVGSVITTDSVAHAAKTPKELQKRINRERKRTQRSRADRDKVAQKIGDKRRREGRSKNPRFPTVTESEQKRKLEARNRTLNRERNRLNHLRERKAGLN